MRKSLDRIIPKNVGLSTRSEISVKTDTTSSSGKNPDFAALIEECIQLGMPKRKEILEETASPILSQNKKNYAKRWPEYLSKISDGEWWGFHTYFYCVIVFYRIFLINFVFSLKFERFISSLNSLFELLIFFYLVILFLPLNLIWIFFSY